MSRAEGIEYDENASSQKCSFKGCDSNATSSTVLIRWMEYRACDEHAAELWRWVDAQR